MIYKVDFRNYHDFSVILNDPNTISAIILGHYYIYIPAPKNSQGRNYVQQGNPISMNFYGTSLRETFPESSETVWVEKKIRNFLFSDWPHSIAIFLFVEHKNNLQNKILALKYWIENCKSCFFYSDFRRGRKW